MVPLVTHPAGCEALSTVAPARAIPRSIIAIGRMSRGRSSRRAKSRARKRRQASNCRVSASRPTKSPLRAERLTAARAAGQAKTGIGCPPGSRPSSWP